MYQTREWVVTASAWRKTAVFSCGAVGWLLVDVWPIPVYFSSGCRAALVLARDLSNCDRSPRKSGALASLSPVTQEVHTKWTRRLEN